MYNNKKKKKNRIIITLARGLNFINSVLTSFPLLQEHALQSGDLKI